MKPNGSVLSWLEKALRRKAREARPGTSEVASGEREGGATQVPTPGERWRHGNGDPADNRLVNLRYATHSENRTDCPKCGPR